MAAIKEMDLVARVRQRADMEDNYFVSDIEVRDYINSGIAELHDLLIQTYGQDYYVQIKEFTASNTYDYYRLEGDDGDSDTYDLNITDFYKLRGMDAQISGNMWTTLMPFNFNERNLNQGGSTSDAWGVANIRYRLVGTNLYFSPKITSTTQVKIWYIPTAQQFTSTTPATSTTTFDDINGYAEYVVLDAAMKCLQKEESDVTVLYAQKKDMKKRIEDSASNRDAGSPLSVSDVYLSNNPFWLSRGP